MTIRQFLIILVCFTSISWVPAVLAEKRICSKEEAVQAEDLPVAKSWRQLYQQFKHYSHCDDGAIGEGFSESVSILLADHWKHVDQLKGMVKSDPIFRKFLIRHINESVPIDRLERISSNAEKQCPQKLKAVCSDIAAAATQAIKESK